MVKRVFLVPLSQGLQRIPHDGCGCCVRGRSSCASPAGTASAASAASCPAPRAHVHETLRRP